MPKDPPNTPPPPDADYAVPTGTIDVYDPDYVPPRAKTAPPVAPIPTVTKTPRAATAPTLPTVATAPAVPAPPSPEVPSSAAAPTVGPTPASPEVTDPAAAEGFANAQVGAPSYSAYPDPASYAAQQASVDPASYSAPTSSDPPQQFAPPQDVVPYPAYPAYPANPDDAPLLPPELAAEGALQHAVGAPSARARKRAAGSSGRGDGSSGDGGDDSTDDGTGKRSRRTMVVASLAIVAGLGTAALVFLGRANSQRYQIACAASSAIAQQGRSFPPWGVRSMIGAEWAPIELPANAECQTRETENLSELTGWYLEILLDRATVTLTAKDILDTPAASANGKPVVSPLDTVTAELDHALLLARDPERRDQRKEITRLQGDVAYWRAALRLRDASAILVDAAKQFDAANVQHPRHATDSAAWSIFLHHLSDELRAGPNGAPIAVPPIPPIAPTTATEPSQPVPVGAALPVEPDTHDTGSAAAPASPVPAGGVLL